MEAGKIIKHYIGACSQTNLIMDFKRQLKAQRKYFKGALTIAGRESWRPILTTTFAMAIGMLFSSFQTTEETTFPLTVKVTDLRNSEGVVQFALYKDADSFPDEHYIKYYRKQVAKIVTGASTVTFENLPIGRYAVSILHDEDRDGKIKKGIILPKEGIGFSNYESIGFSNRPDFNKASFNLFSNKDLDVKIIYL